MPDLEERFRSLARTTAPDLWDEVVTRPPRSLPPAPGVTRFVAGATALLVATGGFVVAVSAFDDAGRRNETPSMDPPSSVANGPITFQRFGGDERELAPGTIESVEPDGSNRHVVFGDDSTRITQLAWSPDGSRIAYVNPIDGERGIYVANADGTDPVRLTEGHNDGHPSWSPDGARIAFSSSAADSSIAFCDGQPGQEFLCLTDIYSMNADGSDVARLTTDPAAEFHPTWSPDGSRIAFARVVRGEAPDEIFEAPLIFTMAADGSDVRQISQASGEWGGSDFSPAWSPDASRIAFVGFRREDFGLYVVGADGSDEREIEEDDFGFADGWRNTPVWSPDGFLIAFVCRADESARPSSLCLIKPDGTGLERIAEVPWSTGDLAWQPRSASGEPPASVDVRVATIGGIGPFPNAVVVGEGGVWVSAPWHDSSGTGEVVRIDPVSGDVVARIPVEALPTWEVGGGGMALGLGRVWVVGSVWASGTGHAVVEEIDPATNAVVDSIDVGVGHGADVWADESGIWALVQEAGGRHRVVRVDPLTHEIVATGDVPAVWSQTIFAAGGWIWVFGDDAAGREGIAPGTVYRIDPGTAQVVEQTEVGATMWVPATASEATWIRVEGGVQRFDPTSGGLVGAPIQPDVGCCTLPFVADGAGGVWVASSADAGGPPWLRHVTADGDVDATGTIDRSDPAWQGVAYVFDPSTSTIWVVHYRDAVSRIEIVAQDTG
jgi:TolB protein